MTIEVEKEYTIGNTENLIGSLLVNLGVDLSDENFKETPRRHAAWLHKYIDEEKSKRAVDHLDKVFPSKNDQMLCTGPVSVFMLCPHHLCPAIMKVWFVYVPRDKVIGLSKIPRYLKDLAHYPMLQEEYTRIALDRFVEKLLPQAAMCYAEGWHTCMIMRGVETVTSVKSSAISDLFKSNPNAKQEALHMIHNGEKFEF